ncbi:metal ABC transporter solute-binding protein, Zn/Mn family [Halalkalibacillus halophilus]|uniref:metal ABC transporter solute-binding protein, Zn/Mn family n=1 Tax=Halalkalibacillus halophilus TaxID=392827 RepID=UPI000420C22D|nr:zinc ABC transporter substrate-binding protein [Halalkalibacillus halophilus]
MKWFTVIILSILLIGCGDGNESGSSSDTLQITTTTAQVGDVVQNIGGDVVEVEALMGPGVDPHLYQPTQSDIRKLGNADMIFYNGLNLEGNMIDVFEQMGDSQPTFAVASSLNDDKLQQDMENPNEVDPHIWFSIEHWIQVSEFVKEKLTEHAPDHEETFTNNMDEYISELEELQAYGEEQFSHIPENQKILVTAHDAFGYFGTEFDFEVVGIQGLSTDSDYGVRDIQDVVSVLVDNEIPAVFTESSVPERAMQSVIDGAESRDHEVELGGELYSDAMGEEGSETGTYIGMYRYNIDTITEALTE